MNLQTEQLVGHIQAGIEEKKGHDIVVADFSGIPEAVCQAFVICTGNSPSHVQALTDSVEEFTRNGAGARPSAVAGLRNAQWVAMDYGTVIVHLFLREAREFYDLEHLWADASITEIPNLD
ncbi:MAG: ribosome silencing factor [Bacteroidaceae bacterium]|nr:ribosome silencing factor [Bacteroidaceae bacterium]